MSPSAMLLAAVSVLVVVATGDPGDGSTRAIEQALRAALVGDATIVVRPADKEISDDALAAMGTAEHATMLGVVSWRDGQRGVTVRFVRLPDGRWTDREVRFDALDVPTERGRTVGFALASMMPGDAFAEHVQPATAALAPKEAPPGVGSAQSTQALASPRPPVDAPSASGPPRPNPLAIDASALAVSAPGGYGGGIGGSFAVRVPLVGALGARAAMGARGEAIGPALATSRVIAGGLGATWQPWLDARRRWAVGARADVLVLHIDIAHLSEDDARAAHLSRFMAGFDAAIEGTFRFSDHASLITAVGTEVAFGRTDVFVHEQKAASLLPVKMLAELGLRVSFP